MVNSGLFGKTFDQQCGLAGKRVTSCDIAPNRRIAAEIILEPLGTNVRVTARDEEHRVLWGYIAGKETVRQVHCLVAVYESLQDILAVELAKLGDGCAETPDAMVRADKALKSMEQTIQWLRKSLRVRKVTDATLERARMVARIVMDANRQISLEGASLKGMKPREE
jgi:hypothetical protein